MNGTISQDYIMKWYMPLLMLIFIAMFSAYAGLFNNLPLLPLLWLSAFTPICFSQTNEKLTHFGAYAVCSHAVTRKQYVNSKYIGAYIALVISVLISLLVCFATGMTCGPTAIISGVVLTSTMCLFGLNVYMMFSFKSDMDSANMYVLILIPMITVNVLLLMFCANMTALLLGVSVVMVICSKFVYRKSYEYGRIQSL